MSRKLLRFLYEIGLAVAIAILAFVLVVALLYGAGKLIDLLEQFLK